MAHEAQRKFCESIRQKFPEKFENVDVLDIGSLDINGNNRYLFTGFTYTGIDVGEGANVDVISVAHEFDPGKQYDVVISTEALEHDLYWKETLHHAYELLKPGGLLLFTCAAEGRPEHGTTASHPTMSPLSLAAFGDYYRNMSVEDFESVFTDREALFSVSAFEFYEPSYGLVLDLYFYGIKTEAIPELLALEAIEAETGKKADTKNKYEGMFIAVPNLNIGTNQPGLTPVLENSPENPESTPEKIESTQQETESTGEKTESTGEKSESTEEKSESTGENSESTQQNVELSTGNTEKKNEEIPVLENNGVNEQVPFNESWANPDTTTIDLPITPTTE